MSKPKGRKYQRKEYTRTPKGLSEFEKKANAEFYSHCPTIYADAEAKPKKRKIRKCLKCGDSFKVNKSITFHYDSHLCGKCNTQVNKKVKK